MNWQEACQQAFKSGFLPGSAEYYAYALKNSDHDNIVNIPIAINGDDFFAFNPGVPKPVIREENGKPDLLFRKPNSLNIEVL